MKKTLLTLVSIATAFSAEVEKKPKPVFLTEVEQLKVEKLQLQMELLDSRKKDASDALTGIVTALCVKAGGKEINDCTVIPPSQQNAAYGATLKEKPATTPAVPNK
jgi:hypothetical protein